MMRAAKSCRGRHFSLISHTNVNKGYRQCGLVQGMLVLCTVVTLEGPATTATESHATIASIRMEDSSSS